MSDPSGLNGALNTYAYAASGPLRRIDRYGLTAADVQGVYRDVGASFGDLNPAYPGVGSFQPQPPGQGGGTDKWDGEIHVDPSWASKKCFTRQEYENLFFILFHESMHSSDPMWQRYLTSNDDDDEHHTSIYQRQVYEQMRPRNRPGNMWGCLLYTSDAADE